ncbi:Sec-independent protein translocase subunit TatA/TatB [Legionella bononiensis]|uniref:Twin-arginine translocase TatA/TatE family subunit n=1 Tax=Legionella bononiensis TaxID=2793102 RepID=A0ABS1WFU4_9GAMM|nr:twin-arginine translocase TatA/TatE family subunit [Legionella bononiensis]MBL7481673.1 twin-arginine translocase TatA/TatE family subunit [Legionella bononiensis]MBL7528221.1 twin-arginine translocase TatA/TatE family subunit [Legionella bononiensis]MBL7562696.1 twin-arginine translocase TatA/TatE family subunit [Legionella bononiensis]
MSSGELLLTFIVAVIVFGPSKLPMLATHLGLLMRKVNQLKVYAAEFWQQQLNEIQLQENKRKAELGDEEYKKTESKPEI